MKISVLKCVLCAAASLALPDAAPAGTFYVSTTGSDSAGGTLIAPFASISKAISTAAAGDTIYLRGGTYNLSGTLSISSSKNGTAAKPFTLENYGTELPTLNFAGEATGARGIQLDASYWTVRGLTVINAKDNGMNITGSYNTIDRVALHNNQDSGLQISAGGARVPSYNRIVNTDSYQNYDPANHGENADGFAAKFRGLGPGNVFDSCRSWSNADDGWDFWGAENGVTVQNSWSFKNGFNIFGDTNWQGDGNGMKLGHDSGTHLLQNNLVWGNRLNGIDVNGNALNDVGPNVIAHGVTLKNNTAYNNGKDGANKTGYNYNFDESYAHVLKNNIALGGGSGNANIYSGVVNDHDTWNSGFAVTAADFASLDDAIASGARLADGTLPYSSFLRLAAGSHLINAGTDVGLDYTGTAPDLGAYEFGVVPEPAAAAALGAFAGLLSRRRRRAV